jgi:hypothetical protein
MDNGCLSSGQPKRLLDEVRDLMRMRRYALQAGQGVSSSIWHGSWRWSDVATKHPEQPNRQG